ncbi:MAG: type II toxin-antitoxin system HicA family toxin [Bryobacteraceae bacterium]
MFSGEFLGRTDPDGIHNYRSQGALVRRRRRSFGLSRGGLAAVRQRGSHRIVQKRVEASTITVPVPLHDPLRRGTLLSIIRQSELPKTLFETGD